MAIELAQVWDAPAGRNYYAGRLSLSLKVVLNAKGKTLLKQSGKVTLILAVTGTPPVGSPVTITKPVTLKTG